MPSSFPQVVRPHPSNASKANTSKPMTITLKRIYDTPLTNDGFRVLIDRLWPRGLTKESAALDLWLQDAAPSTALRKWFNHDPNRWQEFTRRYAIELDQQPDAIEKLRNMARTSRVTLLFGTTTLDWNNAVALKDYLEQKPL